MIRRVPRICELRAAWWGHRALGAARRGLAAGRLQGVVPPPPALPQVAGRGLDGYLRRSHASCLQAALIRQRWAAAHGELRDVVIGVTSPSGGFRAHAWLDAETPPPTPWHTIARVAP